MTEERDQPSTADRIRDFVYRTYIAPARAAGSPQAVVRAGDVHRDMGLHSRMPAVCSALNQKFESRYAVRLLHRRGPDQGANVFFTFHVGPSQDQHPAVTSPAPVHHPVSPRTSAPLASTGRETTVFFVSCVGAKRTTASHAKDLYVSDWFRKARAYVERNGAVWFILSAEYGLISPEQMIEPYDRTLNDLPVTERRHWSERVMGQIDEHLPNAKHVTFLAGAKYREFLADHLARRGIRTECPMQSLRIGEQLAWLERN